jgi:hypothetical protein
MTETQKKQHRPATTWPILTGKLMQVNIKSTGCHEQLSCYAPEGHRTEKKTKHFVVPSLISFRFASLDKHFARTALADFKTASSRRHLVNKHKVGSGRASACLP